VAAQKSREMSIKEKELTNRQTNQGELVRRPDLAHKEKEKSRQQQYARQGKDLRTSQRPDFF